VYNHINTKLEKLIFVIIINEPNLENFYNQIKHIVTKGGTK
jgi:hypothetical protein